MPSNPPTLKSPESADVRLDDWNLLRSFLAVYEVGTLTAAAEVLRLTQPTLGRHVRELEALVGETLFDRRPGRMQPTQRAELLAERLGPLRNGIGSVEQALSGGVETVAGTVRITSSQMFGTLTLPGLLAPLLREEPALQVEVQATDTVENLMRREADIAIRFFRPEQEDVIALQVGDTEVGLFADQRFIDALPRLESPADLRGRFVGDVDLQRALQVAASTGFPLQRSDFIYRSTSTVGQLLAIEAGIGVGAMLSLFAPQRPGLQRVLANLVALPVPVWLCAHDDLRRSARMRRVFDHLAVSLRQMLAAQEGSNP